MPDAAARLRELLASLGEPERAEAFALVDELARRTKRPARHRKAAGLAELSVACFRWTLYVEKYGDDASVRGCARAWHLDLGISERRARYLLAECAIGHDFLPIASRRRDIAAV